MNCRFGRGQGRWLRSQARIINMWLGDVFEPFWTVPFFFLFFPLPISPPQPREQRWWWAPGFPSRPLLLVPLWMGVCFLTSRSLITTPSIPCFCNHPCRDRAPLCPKTHHTYPVAPLPHNPPLGMGFDIDLMAEAPKWQTSLPKPLCIPQCIKTPLLEASSPTISHVCPRVRDHPPLCMSIIEHLYLAFIHIMVSWPSKRMQDQGLHREYQWMLS